MPEFDVYIRKGLACVDVNNLHIENHVDSLLPLMLLAQVAVDGLADDPIWTLRNVGSKNTRAVREDRAVPAVWPKFVLRLMIRREDCGYVSIIN